MSPVRDDALLDGFLVMNKPAGITSHDVVDAVRRLIGIRRVGHLGTLDPMGTGVLVLAVGKATRVVKHFMNDDKEYLTTVRLGTITDTQDLDGKVVETRPVPDLTRDGFEKVLDQFRGDIQQIPPMVSAKKIGGTRLYKLHRRGIEVERTPKTVHIYGIGVLGFNPPDVQFHVHCSKGTYIRTLCADIGERVGCGGAMADLVRTRSGIFTIDQAASIEALRALGPDDICARLISTREALSQRGGTG